MKRLLVHTLLATAVLIPMAKAERVLLTKELMREVSKVPGGLDRMRVYLSTKLEVKASDSDAKDVKVDKDVDIVHTEKQHTDIIDRRTPGKIISAEGFNQETLFVNFDPGCKDITCAYKFNNSEFGHSRRPKETAARFSLSGIPVNKEFDNQAPFTRGSKLIACPNTLVLADECENRKAMTVSLHVDLDELHEIVTTKRKLKGIE